MQNNDEEISFLYRNHRNETSLRKISGPINVYWAPEGSEWHKGGNWFFNGYDLEKKAWRVFALKDADFTCGELSNQKEGIGT